MLSSTQHAKGAGLSCPACKQAPCTPELWVGSDNYTQTSALSLTPTLTNILSQHQVKEGHHLCHSTESSVESVFQRLQPFLTEQERLLLWCGDCCQAIAKPDSVLRSVEESSCFVAFPAEDSSPLAQLFGVDSVLSFLVWTSAPWSLPANEALVINPMIHYLTLQVPNFKELLVIASEALESLLQQLMQCNAIESKSSCVVVGQPVKGAELLHVSPHVAHPTESRWVPLIPSDSVKATLGTGILHIAPSCSPIDQQIGSHSNITSTWKLSEELRVVWDHKEHSIPVASQLITSFMEHEGRLLAHLPITHQQPHCRDCVSHLRYRVVHGSFLNLRVPPLQSRAQDFAHESCQVYPKRAKKQLLSVVNAWLEDPLWLIHRPGDREPYTGLFGVACRMMRSTTCHSPKQQLYVSAYSNLAARVASIFLQELLNPTPATILKGKRLPTPSTFYLHATLSIQPTTAPIISTPSITTTPTLSTPSTVSAPPITNTPSITTPQSPPEGPPLSALCGDVLALWTANAKFTNEALLVNGVSASQDLIKANTFVQLLSEVFCSLDRLVGDVACPTGPEVGALSLSQLQKYLLTELHKTNTKVRQAYAILDLPAVLYSLESFAHCLLALLPMVSSSCVVSLAWIRSVLASLVSPLLPSFVKSLGLSDLSYFTTTDTFLNKQHKNNWLSLGKLKDLVDSQKKKEGVSRFHLQLLSPQRDVENVMDLLSQITADDPTHEPITNQFLSSFLEAEIDCSFGQASQVPANLKQAVLFQ